jgi:hypothetical protein
MKEIIPEVDTALIQAELTEDKFVRYTNFGNNELYIITHHDSPNIMREIGRLREVTFRAAGGGTGKEIDIDKYDTMENPYKQLIVWDPERCLILGGYRYHICKTDKGIDFNLATSRLFEFSDEFKTDYLPYMIELGRSFVQPEFQSTKEGRKAMFALDNLWDGLGALIVLYPNMRYFFGKVTMYQEYEDSARDMLLYFLRKYFSDKDKLVTPINPIVQEIDTEFFDNIFNGGSYEEDYKILNRKVRELGVNIPPLINAYMNLSPSMRVFGTVLNPYFGDVEETAIMVKIGDVYPKKKERHINTYHEQNKKQD